MLPGWVFNQTLYLESLDQAAKCHTWGSIPLPKQERIKMTPLCLCVCACSVHPAVDSALFKLGASLHKTEGWEEGGEHKHCLQRWMTVAQGTGQLNYIPVYIYVHTFGCFYSEILWPSFDYPCNIFSSAVFYFKYCNKLQYDSLYKKDPIITLKGSRHRWAVFVHRRPCLELLAVCVPGQISYPTFVPMCCAVLKCPITWGLTLNSRSSEPRRISNRRSWSCCRASRTSSMLHTGFPFTVTMMSPSLIPPLEHRGQNQTMKSSQSSTDTLLFEIRW